MTSVGDLHDGGRHVSATYLGDRLISPPRNQLASDSQLDCSGGALAGEMANELFGKRTELACMLRCRGLQPFALNCTRVDADVEVVAQFSALLPDLGNGCQRKASGKQPNRLPNAAAAWPPNNGAGSRSLTNAPFEVRWNLIPNRLRLVLGNQRA